MKAHAYLLLGCLSVSVWAQASSPLQPLELSDSELAQLRGRYVLPGGIVHFGIAMSSVWVNANDQVLGGRVEMHMSEGMFQPQFHVYTLAGGSEEAAPPAGSGLVQGGAGLGKVDGISQSVRSAGDFNSAQNDLRIVVSRGAPAPTVAPNEAPLAAASASNAGSVQVAPTAGGFQIAIQAAGQGSSLQQLGHGGLQQHTTIVGSNNAVTNLTSIDLILRDAPLGAEQLRSAWNQLTLRPTGY
ncbi:hypothetical protein NGA35_06730 [Pseudomonas stutzeri]|nr:hypothetical protein [Stutzerimonas stutzeri]